MDTRERVVKLILIIFLYNRGSFVVISMQGKLNSKIFWPESITYWCRFTPGTVYILDDDI